MKNISHNSLPEEIIIILKTLENAGFEAYLVGGCVRDYFLGRKAKDWDITTNAKPEEIQKLFSKTVYENIYGTVAVINETTKDNTLRTVEITPYRLESEYSDKRHPDKVEFSQKIDDDLKRRDFTVNAIAFSIHNGAVKDIVDLYNGVNDLKDKTIRAVGNPSDRFTEDALRIVRAVRFATELGFTIEEKTRQSIVASAEMLSSIAIERIREEFTKIIMSDNPKSGIEMLKDLNLLKYIVPELEKSVGVTQNQAHAYDVWNHLLRSLQCAADKHFSLELRLSALFHDISKPKTKGFSRENNQITFYNHEVDGARETFKILNRLKFSREIIDKVTKLVRWHMFFSDTEIVTLSAVRRMIANVGKENIWDLMNLRICDRVGTGRPKENPYRLRKYKSMIEEASRDPISLKMLKIDGGEIMKVCNAVASPKVGYILHALFDQVLNNPDLNNKEYLIGESKRLYSLSEIELKALGEKGKNKKHLEDEKIIEEIRKRHFVK